MDQQSNTATPEKHSIVNWLQVPADRRKLLIEQTAIKEGFSSSAVEKDWWVTLALYAVFQTRYAPNLVFKGGTSLSKGWGLITRFSEDIDLAIDRSVLGFGDHSLAPGDVKRLRKASAAFMGGEFLEVLQQKMDELGVKRSELRIWAEDITSSDADPRNIFLEYDTFFPVNGYLKSRVTIEIGARSLREPYTMRPITSLISSNFPGTQYGAPAFEIPTVNPERTFLEKLMLLHEEFLKEKPRHYRLSRHLYDIHAVMDSQHGEVAANNHELLTTILTHRKTFNPIKGVEYDTLTIGQINFIPPAALIDNWEADYKEMFDAMLGSGAPTFTVVTERLNVLKARLTEIDEKRKVAERKPE
ncbi:nucleotidyl transferase AbiEii/AbiGii toxin family protein [[Flexibacter] sp. ATCC 35208]|uniref:nucleotidyl transferase AbiEii/AbiGii toxin family protein n=1 Tax=[Flexibacter] sp. ATCC 35208 TaxID=1936242 RepID=UPI0009D42043|nr:nucleotidyl transferase AbiEii/AbiGii toxin family protein [[Flexibacter] sp. ATCC 35208]OMP80049.1 hypothetical protein BW716_06030 [[Flexibacter] sp. ATCC 35208]